MEGTAQRGHAHRRSGSSPPPGSSSSGCRSRRRAATSPTVYMALGWIGAFSFVPLYESTGWPGVLPDRGRRPPLHHRRDRARGPQTRSVARDVRLPRDLPRVRDPGRPAPLLRDRVPRAAARPEPGERLRPRAAGTASSGTPTPTTTRPRTRRRSTRPRRGASGAPRGGARGRSATSAASTCSSSGVAMRGGRCTSPPTARASSRSTSRPAQFRHARALSADDRRGDAARVRERARRSRSPTARSTW